MSNTIVAIDPGLKGGLAWHTPEGEVGAIRMPLSAERKFDPCVILEHLRPHVGPQAELWVERQHAMPKQGVSSTFTTGFNYGQLVGLGLALGFDVHVVAARTWKGHLLAPEARKGKEGTMAYVEARFPEIDLIPPRGRVKSDGIADAAAILAYALEQKNP